MEKRIQEIPQQFKTSDGQKFDDRALAERHEALLSTRAALKSAAHDYSIALAKSQLTADGQMFDFGLFRDYYFVRPGWGAMPEVIRVEFMRYECEELCEYRGVSIRKKDGSNSTLYPINELYVSESTARREVIRLQRLWLKERAAEIEKNAKKWAVE